MSSLIRRGYGSSAALVITRGFGSAASVAAQTLRDVSGHGEPSSLSPRERALLNVEEAFRSTTPASAPAPANEKPVEKPNVVRLDDYRPLEPLLPVKSPSFEAMDGGIAKLQDDLAVLLAGMIEKDMRDMQAIAYMNDLEEELAATLLLLE